MGKLFRGGPHYPRVMSRVMSSYPSAATYAFTHIYVDGASVSTRKMVLLVLDPVPEK